MFLVMMEWTSEMSSVNFAMFRCVRVSMYNFLVFCMKVSADNAHSCAAHHWQHIINAVCDACRMARLGAQEVVVTGHSRGQTNPHQI